MNSFQKPLVAMYVTAFTLVGAVTHSTHAITRTWIGGSSSTWNLPDNWSPNGVPTSSDHAVINTTGLTQVILDINTTIAQLTVGGGAPSTQFIHATNRTLTVNGPITINPTGLILLIDSTLNGTGSISNSGQIRVNGNCTINPTGGFAINSGGLLRVQANTQAATLNFSGTISNSGAIELTYSGGLPPVNSVTITGGTIQNQTPGSVIDILPGDTTATPITRNLNVTLINSAGAVNVATSCTISRPSASHSNGGAINVNAGVLEVAQTGIFPQFNNSGIINCALGDFHVQGGSFTNTGTITIANNRYFRMLFSGTFNHNGAINWSATGASYLNLQDVAVNLNINLTNTSFGRPVLTRAVINGPGVLVNNGVMEISGCSVNVPLTNNGQLSVNGQNTATFLNSSFTQAGSLMLVGNANGNAVLVAPFFTNNGTITLTSGPTPAGATISVGFGTLTNPVGRFIDVLAGQGGSRSIDGFIANSGTININTACNFGEIIFQSFVPGVLNNNASGIVNITGGNLTLNSGGATAVSNAGIIDISPSRMLMTNEQAVENLPGGLIRGSGIIWTDFQLINHGTIAPGPAIGGASTLSTNFAYDQAPDGSLAIEVNGPSAGAQFDQFQAGQSATLAGTLNVTLNPSYLPAAGTNFTILTTPTLDGRFDVAHFNAAFPDGRYLAVNYTSGVNVLGGGAVNVTVYTLTNAVAFDPGLTQPLPGTPTAGVLGDFDGDGDLDLAVTITADPPPSAPGSVVVLKNAGTINGVWQGFAGSSQYTVGIDPSAITAGLFNLDNSLDVAVTNRVSGSVSILTNANNGTGSFMVTATIPVGSAGGGGQPSSIAAGNFNGPINLAQTGVPPGETDLIVANANDNSVQVLLNNGSGSYFPMFPIPLPGGIRPVQVDPADVDNDRDLDFAVVCSSSNNMLLFPNTNGTGNFGSPTAYAIGSNPRDVLLRDFNGDGLPDMVSANANGDSITVRLNNPPSGGGPGTFGDPIAGGQTIPVGDNARSLAALDADGDGDLDLAVLIDVNGQSSIQLLRNNPATGSALNFTQGNPLPTGDGAVEVLAGNLDGQGAEDILTVNSGTAGLAANPRRGQTLGAGPDVSVFLNSTLLCAGNTNGDTVVNIDDLFFVINQWGACPAPPASCSADLAPPPTGNGFVNIDDLFFVINHWGACQ